MDCVKCARFRIAVAKENVKEWKKLNFFRKSCEKLLTNPKKYAIIVVSNG
jgi:hypothetical protein